VFTAWLEGQSSVTECVSLDSVFIVQADSPNTETPCSAFRPSSIRMTADTDAILAEPVYAELAAMTEELREHLVCTIAKVEEKLDQLAG